MLFLVYHKYTLSIILPSPAAIFSKALLCFHYVFFLFLFVQDLLNKLKQCIQSNQKFKQRKLKKKNVELVTYNFTFCSLLWNQWNVAHVSFCHANLMFAWYRNWWKLFACKDGELKHWLVYSALITRPISFSSGWEKWRSYYIKSCYVKWNIFFFLFSLFQLIKCIYCYECTIFKDSIIKWINSIDFLR
jgi:hypothetical protein